MTLLIQGMIFAAMMATGLVLGLWVDLFRFINKRGQVIFAPVIDLLFWAVMTCVVFVVLINLNFLELRMYVFLSLALGLVLYFKLFSCHIMQLYAWGFETTVKVLKWLWRCVQPVGFLFRAAAGLVDMVVALIFELFIKIMVRVGLFRGSRQENPPTP